MDISWTLGKRGDAIKEEMKFKPRTYMNSV